MDWKSSLNGVTGGNWTPVIICDLERLGRTRQLASSAPYADSSIPSSVPNRIVPELPDITVYVEALNRRVAGARLEDVRLKSPFLLRSVDPPISALKGKEVREVRRLGKRIVFAFDDELFLVLHLMIAGRLKWRDAGKKPSGKIDLAAFDFSTGTVLLTEAGTKKRASLHVVAGRDGLEHFDRGGLEVLDATGDDFAERLTSESHTVKRALTDPRLFSGIGNAYSDEILHTAKMSPFALTAKLTDDQLTTLFEATRQVETDAVARSVGQKAAELKGEKRAGMRVHARTGLPCPVCGDTVREVSFADKSLQYCPTCQTGGKPLADRRLSKLIR
jgi:formamidopyrimidine-DNA glycosylase